MFICTSAAAGWVFQPPQQAWAPVVPCSTLEVRRKVEGYVQYLTQPREGVALPSTTVQTTPRRNTQI